MKIKNNTVAYRKRLQYTDVRTSCVVDIIGKGLEENVKKVHGTRRFHPVIMYIHLFFSYSQKQLPQSCDLV